MSDPVTGDTVKEWVEGVIAEWFDGMYTDRQGDDKQRCVRHWSDDMFLVQQVTKTGGRDHDRKFRVKVDVEEVF